MISAGLPHLDIYTLSETWAVSEALHSLWAEIGASLGVPPSKWTDDDGRRIYAAVVALKTSYDLSNPVFEDAQVSQQTNLVAIRKPHAVGETVFLSDGRPVLSVRLLTTLVRRDTAGTNKKLSKVRNLWQAEDRQADIVENWLAAHHAAKQTLLAGPSSLVHEANRLADFNAADLFYFRNFLHLARAAEWKAGRNLPPQLAFRRNAFFYANVDDGDKIEARCKSGPDERRTELSQPDGKLLFVSSASFSAVTIPAR